MLKTLVALVLMVVPQVIASNNSVELNATTTEVIGTSTQEIIALASSTFQGTPLMAICKAESVWRQYGDDGKPLLGIIIPSDIGFCQINRHYHQAEADALQLDLTTPEGNIWFALWLYRNENTTPWNWSKDKWQGKI